MSSIKIVKYFVLLLTLSLFLVIAAEPGYTYSNQLSMLEKVGFDWLARSLSYKPNETGINLSELSDSIYLFEAKNPDDAKNSGYIVMKHYEQGEQIEIIEYGIGTILPYTPQIIVDESLLQKKAEYGIYYSPLESFLVYKTDDSYYYIDNATGDLLPDLSNFKAKVTDTNNFASEDSITAGYLNKDLIFDPYSNLDWLLADQNDQVLTSNELISLINANKFILYSGAKYNNSVKFAYSVIGYQQVNDIIYIAIHDMNLDLTRFIELNNLLNYGKFTTGYAL